MRWRTRHVVTSHRIFLYNVWYSASRRSLKRSGKSARVEEDDKMSRHAVLFAQHVYLIYPCIYMSVVFPSSATYLALRTNHPLLSRHPFLPTTGCAKLLGIARVRLNIFACSTFPAFLFVARNLWSPSRGCAVVASSWSCKFAVRP